MDLPWFPPEASLPLGWANTYHVLRAVRAERQSSSLSRPAIHLLVGDFLHAVPHPLPLAWDPDWNRNHQAQPSGPRPGSLLCPAPPKTDPPHLPASLGEALGLGDL